VGRKRKTKKEKIILSLKRQLKQQQIPQVEKPVVKTIVSSPIDSPVDSPQAILLSAPISEIKKDLIKSLFLSGVAIACLFLVYSR